MKLDSHEAKQRDERRAVRFERLAAELETRATRHIIQPSRRGGVAVSHTVNFLRAKIRRLRALANKARYRNRRKIVKEWAQDDGF